MHVRGARLGPGRAVGSRGMRGYPTKVIVDVRGRGAGFRHFFLLLFLHVRRVAAQHLTYMFINNFHLPAYF